MTINTYFELQQNSNSVAQATNSSSIILSGPINLTAASNGHLYINQVNGAIVTIPSYATLPSNWQCSFFNQTWGSILFSTNGTDLINCLGPSAGSFTNAAAGSYSYTTIRLLGNGFFSVSVINPYDIITANVIVDYTTFASGFIGLIQNLPSYSGPMLPLDVTAFVDITASGITTTPQFDVVMNSGLVTNIETITAAAGQSFKLPLANPGPLTSVSGVNDIKVQGQRNAVATSMTGSISVCMFIGENTFPSITS